MTVSFSEFSRVAFAEITGLTSDSVSLDAPSDTAFDLDNFFLEYGRFLGGDPDGTADPHAHEFSLTLDLADLDGLGGLLNASHTGQIFSEMTLTTMFTGFGGEAVLQQEVTLQNISFYSFGMSLETTPRIGVEFDAIEIVNYDVAHAFLNPTAAPEVLETFALDLTDSFDIQPNVFNDAFLGFSSLVDTGASTAFLNIPDVSGTSFDAANRGAFDVIDFAIGGFFQAGETGEYDSIYVTIVSGNMSMSELYQHYFSQEQIGGDVTLHVQFPGGVEDGDLREASDNFLELTFEGGTQVLGLRENSDGSVTLRLLAPEIQIVTRELLHTGQTRETSDQTVVAASVNPDGSLFTSAPFDDESYIGLPPDDLDATLAIGSDENAFAADFQVVNFDLTMPFGDTQNAAVNQRLVIDVDPAGNDLNALYQAWADGTVLNDVTFTLQRAVGAVNHSGGGILPPDIATEQEITFDELRVVSIAEANGYATQIELAYDDLVSSWTQTGTDITPATSEAATLNIINTPEATVAGDLAPVGGARAEFELDSTGTPSFFLDGPAGIFTDNIGAPTGTAAVPLYDDSSVEIMGYELEYRLSETDQPSEPLFSTLRVDMALESRAYLNLMSLLPDGDRQVGDDLVLYEMQSSDQVSRKIILQNWTVVEVGERGGFGAFAQFSFERITIEEFQTDGSGETTLLSQFSHGEEGVLLSTYDLGGSLDTPDGLQLEMHASIGSIRGDSVDENFEGQFNIQSYAFGLTREIDNIADLQTGDIRSPIDAVFLTLDVAPGQSGLTGLMAALADGDVFDEIVLTTTNDTSVSGSTTTRTISLADAVIHSIEEATDAASRVLIGYDGVQVRQVTATPGQPDVTDVFDLAFDERGAIFMNPGEFGGDRTEFDETQDGVSDHTPGSVVSAPSTDLEINQDIFLFLEGFEGDSVVVNQSGAFDVNAMEFDLDAFQGLAAEGNLGIDFAPITVEVFGSSVGLFNLLEETALGQQIPFAQIRMAQIGFSGPPQVYQTITLNNVSILGYQSIGLEGVSLELGYGQIHIETSDFNNDGTLQVSPYVLDLRTDDNVIGTDGNDTLDGGAGNDTLLAGDGDDSVLGGSGNDSLIGGSGLGDDTYLGGDGIDTLAFPSTSLGIIVDMGSKGFATGTEIGTDAISGFENLVLGFGDDLATGNDGDNLIEGLDGADTILGLGGNDTLIGGPGEDSVDGGADDDTLIGDLDSGRDTYEGGAGTDVLDYSASSLGIEVILDTNGFTLGAEIGNDVIFNVEHVILGSGDDFASAFSGGRTLDGREGNDTLFGLIGDDLLIGGDGHDELHGEDGNDTLQGGVGDDSMFGGIGDDLIESFDGDNSIEGGTGIDVIATGAGDDFIAAGLSDLADGEDTVFAGGGDDTIIGGYFIDELHGEGGNDQFLLFSDDFGDNIFGGTGFDTLDLSGMTFVSGIVVDLLAGTYFYDAAPSFVFSITEVEHIVGADFDDTILADGFDLLQGGEGDDVLFTNGFEDTLEGGNGFDLAVLSGRSSTDMTVLDAGAHFTLLFTSGDTVTVGKDVELFEFQDITLDTIMMQDLVDLPPTGTLAIVGTPTQGQLLGADRSAVSDPNGYDGGFLTHQWFRDGIAILGEDSEFYALTQDDVGEEISVRMTFLDGLGNEETITSGPTTAIANVNDAPQGDVLINGTALQGETLSVDTSGLSDLDGLGALRFRWQRDGVNVAGENGTSYVLGQDDVGAEIRAVVRYTDDEGTAEIVFSQTTAPVASLDLSLVGTAGDDVLAGGTGNDTLDGLAGNDRLSGGRGNDSILGGDGVDTLIGEDGNDTLIGGSSVDDLRDVIFAGAGDDLINGGHGNDELRGDAGNDNIAGDFGADTVIGGTGDDTLTGSALGDLLFGGDGADFVNGGFGHDLVNGGADADRFFHIGIFDHGSDWIQDYASTEGDVLHFGDGTARASDFQINTTHTVSPDGERSGDDSIAEAFVIYRPTEQIIWALVDGDGQAQINLRIGTDVFDLLA